MKNSFLFAFLCFCVLSAPVFAEDEVRFVSLRRDKVNLRTGPGERFPILWVYQAKGYPVEVIDRYDIWRRIREIDNTDGWVHQNMISNTRTAFVREEGNLTNKPAVGAKVIAIAQQGTMAKIERCPAQNDYCLLSFQHNDKTVKGWFLRRQIWGIYPDEEID